MKILQLTDLHVNSDGRRAFLRADSLGDLRRTVDYLLRVELRPDVTIVTGDVSTDGSESAYTLVREELERLGCPVWVLPGNHDRKAPMKKVLGDVCHTALDGVPGICVDTDEARLLLFDSATENEPAGGMNEAQLMWLAEHLDGPEERPVMLWMHHFPFRSGYRGMDHPFEGEARLLELLQGRNTYVCSGHLHAGVIRRLGSVTMLTAPAVSMLMELRPDTVRFYTQQAGFALHLVEDGAVTTHLCAVPGTESGGPYRFVE
jgi:3',5'-cyclic AMP phosphodiesterase CpdA